MLSEKADVLLKTLEDTETMHGRVEGLLLPILRKGEANVEAVAAALRMSRQTLSRRLKAEEATFAKVLD